jgi:hypothetical protein
MTCMHVWSCVWACAKRAIGWQWLILNSCDTWRCWSDRTHVIGCVWSLRMCVRSMRRKSIMAIFGLWAINSGVSRLWLRLSTLGDFLSMLKSAWEPSNSIVLVRVRIDCEWVILVLLQCEIALSGTRCSNYKPMVLVTLGGYHILDNLVASSPS